MSPGTTPTVPVTALVRGLLLLGSIAPSLVALGVTALDSGTAGTQALLGRMFEWRAGARWYVFAIGYMAAIKLSVALAHHAITGSWPRFGNEAWYIAARGKTICGAGRNVGNVVDGKVTMYGEKKRSVRALERWNV